MCIRDSFGRDRDTADEFVVEPPFLDWIAHAVTEAVVQPRRDRHQYRLDPLDVDPEPVCRTRQQSAVGVYDLVDRAGLHAATAGRAFRGGHAVARAPLHVRLQYFVAVEHHLVAQWTRAASTIARATG